MPPKRISAQDEPELFRSRLENIIDQRHPLVRLARLIDWPVFEARFGEAVCARSLDSPYVQAFCGETHFQHALPLDRSSMTRWRQRVGAERMELLLAETLGLINRLFRQKRADRSADKLYALHAPEVECIGKGNARTRFECGVKVSVATTNAAAPDGQFGLGMRSPPGNPYDGHTLAGQIAQVERITGIAVDAYVDRGYRGHDAGRTRVFVPRQKRGITPTIRRELRRRAAIEPVIGHMKTDGHLGRNFLRGVDGDAINAILAGVDHNLRLLRRWLGALLCALFAWLTATANSSRSAPTAHQSTSCTEDKLLDYQ